MVEVVVTRDGEVAVEDEAAAAGGWVGVEDVAPPPESPHAPTTSARQAAANTHLKHNVR